MKEWIAHPFCTHIPGSSVIPAGELNSCRCDIFQTTSDREKTLNRATQGWSSHITGGMQVRHSSAHPFFSLHPFSQQWTNPKVMNMGQCIAIPVTCFSANAHVCTRAEICQDFCSACSPSQLSYVGGKMKCRGRWLQPPHSHMSRLRNCSCQYFMTTAH